MDSEERKREHSHLSLEFGRAARLGRQPDLTRFRKLYELYPEFLGGELSEGTQRRGRRPGVLMNGARIKELRRLSQQALADKSGIALRTIQNAEMGRRIHPANVKTLAEALDTTIEEIVLPASNSPSH